MEKMKPQTVFALMSAAAACFFALAFTLAAVYRVEVAGLNPLQLILVGTILELAVFVFEIPTGLLADRRSRKWSVIFGYGLVGLGFVVEGSLPVFGWILWAQVLWGVGYTFTDGAQTAWLVDEIHPLPVGPVLVRGAQAGSIGSLLGIVIAVWLGQYSLHWPIVTAGVLFMIMALGLTVAMKETRRPHVAAAAGWRDHLEPLRAGRRLLGQQPVLWLLLAAALLAGLASEGMDRFWEFHFLRNVGLPALAVPSLGQLPPIYWFGLINAVGMLLTLGAAEIVRRRMDFARLGLMAVVLFLVNALYTASIVLFALAGEFSLALGAYLGSSLLRSVQEPLYEAWVNAYLPNAIRATMLSVVSLVNSLGQIAGGPLIGLAASLYGVPWALVVTAMILLPVSVLYLATLRHRAPAASEGSE